MNRTIKIMHELSWFALLIVAAIGLGVQFRFILLGIGVLGFFRMLSIVGRAEEQAVEVMLRSFEDQNN